MWTRFADAAQHADAYFVIRAISNPNGLKIAQVTPLHKEGSKPEMKNYCPISILSVLNKIFETIIKRRLLNFWKK